MDEVDPKLPVEAPSKAPRRALDRLGVFATCKSFDGDFGRYQHLALSSWRALGLNVLLIGSDPGTREAAAQYGFAHRPAESVGPPRLDWMFECAADHFGSGPLCYINADILLPARATDALACATRTACHSSTLATGRRVSLPISQSGAVHAGEAEATIQALAPNYGSWDHAEAVDYFLFSRDFLAHLKPFLIGHTAWDDYLLATAYKQGFQVIDMSPDMPVYHPLHGYAGSGGYRRIWTGEGALDNRRLAGEDLMSLDQACTHVLRDGRVEPAASAKAAGWQSPRLDLDRFLRAAVVKLLEIARQDRPLAEAGEIARGVLSRAGRYFPLLDWPPAAALTDAAWLAELEKQSADAIADYLEDAMLAPFFASVEAAAAAGGRFFMHGTGETARRALRAFARNGLTPAALIEWDDRLDAAGGTIQDSCPVIGYRAVKNDLAPADRVLLASMFADAIKEAYQPLGLHEGQALLF